MGKLYDLFKKSRLEYLTADSVVKRTIISVETPGLSDSAYRFYGAALISRLSQKSTYEDRKEKQSIKRLIQVIKTNLGLEAFE